MSYCLNPSCQKPENPEGTKFCQSCGSKLLLKERYRALQPIGQGGFGRTFLAVDEDKPSKPHCAIKQFLPQAQGTNTAQKAAELFNQEAMRLDELGKHPQIPELLAYFTQDEQQYLVQEFIEGQNLAQELEQGGAFNETQIRQLLNDLSPVLQFFHDRQVIHRDIKPENIIRRRSDRQLVLVDFGASKIATNTALLRTGTSIGSPEYIAPEQLRCKAVFSSDIYSLGATCIHLLTQMSPFDLYDIHSDVWIWQQYLKNPLSNSLACILDKMLENATNRRYQSATDVLKDLHSQSNIVAEAKAQTSAKPGTNSLLSVTSSKQSISQIDKELAELKSQFINPAQSKSENNLELAQPKKQPSISTKSQSDIELELEQIKAQFLNCTPPQNSVDS